MYDSTNMKQVELLGIGIDDVSLQEAGDMVKQWLDGKNPKPRYIVTPNPEFLVMAQDDLEFKVVLNSADLAIPDGVGLKLTGKIINTTAGTDLMEFLCKLAAESGYSVGLIGGKIGVAKKATECLSKKFPGLEIKFTEAGPMVDWNGKQTTDYRLQTTVDILFVAFGMGKQEKWISHNLERLPVKVAMGVGGAFDYLSGEIPRAPLLIRKLGFEWLFRLIIQPWRIKRQLSLIRYAWLVIYQRLFK